MELNHLPDELFHALFGYFTVPTLLTTCALVCKRWKELIHQMRFKELYFESVANRNRYTKAKLLGQPTYIHFWVHPPVPVDPRYLVYTWRTSFLDFPFIKMFEYLKRLKLNWNLDCFSSQCDFDKLNQFSALEELDVRIYFWGTLEKTLKLPKLRVLKLKFQGSQRTKLTIDCPIKVLFIQYYLLSDNEDDDEDSPLPPPASFTLVHPDLLEEIIPSDYAYLLNFSACKNVRICRISPMGQREVDHLELFPNLQELHYQCDFGTFNEGQMEGPMNAVRSRISGVLQKKKQQNRKVKIFFQGIQLEGERFLESLEMKKMSDLPKLQFQHYDLLATNLYYYNKIDYSSLEMHFDNSLPGDLFSRFTCVNTVTATGAIKHLDQFATFLRQCKYLCQLFVEIDLLDQNFCDQLHVNCFFLKKLVLRDGKSKDQPFKKLNFDFLAKQVNLISFIIGEFDIETALRYLPIRSSNLKYFSFLYFNECIWITISKENQPYTLDASLSSFKHASRSSFKDAISLSCSELSIDELALDLEFFKKKITKKLALVSKS